MTDQIFDLIEKNEHADTSDLFGTMIQIAAHGLYDTSANWETAQAVIFQALQNGLDAHAIAKGMTPKHEVNKK